MRSPSTGTGSSSSNAAAATQHLSRRSIWPVGATAITMALDKALVADLLNHANPGGLGGFGDPFRFPFVTTEDVVILDDRTLGVLNDNNFLSRRDAPRVTPTITNSS
jgi:hypothetical protein